MALKPDSNREIVYKTLDAPMTLVQLKLKLPKKIPALRAVLHQLVEMSFIMKTGKREHTIFTRIQNKSNTARAQKKTKKRYPNSGLAYEIDKYLKKRIGQTIEQHVLKKDLRIGDTSISSKLSYLNKQGKIKYDRSTMPASIIVLPSMVDNYVSREAQPRRDIKTVGAPIHTPQARTTELMMQAVLDTQPLDIAGLMHRVTQIDHQNNIYRNALEQIVLILEQVHIIETQK